MNKDIWKNPGVVEALDESQNPLWFWNDKLEEDELIRQLEMKSQVGVKCTTPHARLNGGEGYIGGYLDEDWFEKTRVVLEYKKQAKEPVWLYDEMDWPAGTCNKTLTLDEKNREQYLSFQKIEIKAGECFRAQLKELRGKNLAGIQQVTEQLKEYGYNVFLLDAQTLEPYPLLDYIKFSYIGATVDFTPKKDALAYVVTIHTDSYESWGAGCVNYLDEQVTKKFLDSTYEKYYERFPEYFGSTIKCVFNDETRMANAFPWMRRFPEEFEKRKGYDIVPKLVDLVLSKESAGRTRCDYYDVVAELFQENYFKVLGDWCREHGIGLYAHLLGEETLASQVRYSGDFLRQMRYLDVCGADHLGKGIGSLNIKFTSGAARSYGKKRTAVEVFAGCGWDMAFEEYLRMISWMFQQGMQIIINHGFFYSDRGARKNDWPPSQFFQWKGWERMQEGNAMIRRLHYALTDGVPETDLLLYVPVESFWMDYIGNELYKHGYNEGPKINGKEAEKIDKKLQYLMNDFLCENLDFDLLHRDAISNFEVRSALDYSGKERPFIYNKKNGQKFSVLLFPMCKVLTIGALELACEFAQKGGSVILWDTFPEYVMEWNEEARCKELVKRLRSYAATEFFAEDNYIGLYERMKELLPQPVKLISGGENNRNFHPCYTNGLIDPYLHTGEDISGVRFVRYIKDEKRNIFLMNYDNTPKEVVLEVETDAELEAWDTFSGEIVGLKSSEIITKEDCMGRKVICQQVKLELPCNYGVIVTEMK